jgi:dipeptidyl aminopeptidase/acylaminoacyl peptidase
MKTSLRLVLLLPLPAIALAASAAPAAPAALTRPATLVAEGLPPIPAHLADDVRRYTEARSAAFASWHPTRLEMLVGTRFGNTSQIHLVTAPLGARRQLTFFEEPVPGATFDRGRGDSFVFARDQGGNEFGQLYRYDFADGAITRLTDGGRSQNGNVRWSTRGDRFAYTSTRRNGADRDLYVMDPRQPQSDRLLAELRGGGWGATDWSPDDRTVILHEYVSINESHLWLVDAASGRKSELTPRQEARVAYGDAEFSPDGRGVFLTTDKDFEFKRLAYLDLASRQLTYLTTDIPHDVTGMNLTRDGRRLAFSVNQSGRGRLYLLDVASRRYREVPGLPTAVLSLGAWHSDGRHLAFSLNHARAATDVYVLDAETGEITRWTESELGGLVAAQLNEAELIRWKSFDGLEITGFRYRPAARFTGRRPVLISIHGGPESRAEPVFQGRTNYYLNELGVAVIYPNVRGSSGFGKTFVALDNGRLRENSVKDIGALLDWIAQQPDLDASRVMIAGGSYGGYMTLASAVHYGDRVRCFLDVVGISNWITFLENTESYRRDLRRAEYGDERDPEMRKFLAAISPQAHADKIKRPLFIVQGANDPRVPRGESVQMVETIRRHGGKVWYLEGTDEGHGFRKKGNADFQFYATIVFMREHLLPASADAPRSE